jgi:ferredoxin, 2Fe-2S
MSRVLFTQADGETRAVDGLSGESIMQMATRVGVPGILAQCGGTLSCATCHVYVSEEDLQHCGQLAEFEDEMLDTTAADRESNSRLSCQVVPEAGLVIRVRIPENQL